MSLQARIVAIGLSLMVLSFPTVVSAHAGTQVQLGSPLGGEIVEGKHLYYDETSHFRMEATWTNLPTEEPVNKLWFGFFASHGYLDWSTIELPDGWSVQPIYGGETDSHLFQVVRTEEDSEAALPIEDFWIELDIVGPWLTETYEFDLRAFVYRNWVSTGRLAERYEDSLKMILHP